MHHLRANTPVPVHVFMAAPALLALGLALAAPGWRLAWLASGLMISAVLTLASMIRSWPTGGHPRRIPAFLLALAVLPATFLPLAAGLVLLAAVRLAWAWRLAPLPGFPMMEAALLLAAVPALLPA